MREQCENCQNLQLCPRKEPTMDFRKELSRMEMTRSWRGISGIINFHCDYFREKEVKE